MAVGVDGWIARLEFLFGDFMALVGWAFGLSEYGGFGGGGYLEW